MKKLYLLIIIFWCFSGNNQLLAQACSVTISTNPNTTQLNCTVAQITLKANPAGSGTITYSWSTGATTASINVKDSGIYTVTIKDTRQCTSSSSIHITKDTATPGVSILAFPDKICKGSSATLVGIGAVTYLWSPGSDTGTTVVVHPAATQLYTVIGTASNGCKGKSTFNLVVNPLPLAIISGSASVCQDAAEPVITFTGSKGIKPYTFTYNINNGPTQTITTSGNNSSVAVNVSTGTTGSFSYNLTSVADSNGCTRAQTGTASVTVLPAPVFTSSKTESICDSTPFNYMATSSADSSTTFSWKRNTVRGISNPTKSGKTASINDTLNNTTTQPVVVNYFFTLSTGSGCVAHDTLEVTVNPTPKINPIPDYTFCNGTDVIGGIKFSSSSPNASFTWTNNNTNIGLPIRGSGNIPRFTATNSSNDSVIQATITVKITASSDNCAGSEETFIITVLPAPVLTSLKTKSVCDNTSFKYMATSSAVGTTNFSWKRPVVAGISNPAGSGTTDSINETLHNTIAQPVVVNYIFTLSTGIGCVTHDTLKVTVNPTPKINAISDYTFCNGSLNTLDSFKSRSPNASFAWTNSNPNIGLPISGSGNIPPFTATNSNHDSIIAATITVKITASSDNCAGDSDTFIISVLATPVLASPKTESICNGSAFKYTAKSSAAGTNSFSWTRPIVAGISNPAGSGKKASINETLNDTTDQPVVVNYIFRLSTDSGCVGYDTLKVTVNPTPKINAIPDYTFCNGSLATLDTFKSRSPNASFTWINSNPNIGLGTSGSGNILPFIATNSSNNSIKATITVSVTASSDNCPGPDSTFIITVQPAAVLTSLKTASICNKGEFNYTASSSATGTSFGWIRLSNSHISPVPGSDTNKTNLIQETLINDTTQPVLVYYIFTLSTGNGCVTIDTLKLTVNPTPVINPIFDTAFCNGTFVSNGIPIKSKTQDASITWRVTNNVSIGLPSNGTGNIPRFFATNTTDTSVTANLTANIAVGNNNECKGDAKTFTITVYPTARLIGTRDTSICDNTTFNYTAISSAANTIFSWRRDFVKGVSNTADSAITDSINEILHNITDTPVVVKYLFILTNGNNCNADDSIYVTVNPTPKILSVTTGSPYCNSSSVDGIALTSASPESTIKWTSDTTIGFGTNGIDSIHAFTATNTGTRPLTATINATITASTDNCPGPGTTFTITVLPTPHLLSVTDTSICNNVLFKDSAISSADNTIFSWMRQANSSITPDPNPNQTKTNLIEEKLHNDSAQSVDVEYLIHLSTDSTSSEPGCNTDNTLTVKINPTPVTDFIPDKVFCNTELVTGIPFSSKTDETSFSWTNGNTNIGLPASGNGNITGFIATNTTSDAIMSKVKVSITTSDHCPGPDTTFTITVNPSAAKPYFTSLVLYDSTLGLCSGSYNISFNVNAPVTGTDYKWSSDITDSNIVHIKSTNYPNTVISFLQPGNDSIKVKATNTAHGGCSDTSIFQIVKVTNPDGIREQKIFEKGHLLIYPDNSLDPLTGYQWGYDSIISLADKNFGPPVPIQGQVYQFFVPDAKFINGQGDPDTTRYLFWVALQKGGCYSKVYYNGPYTGNNLVVVPPSATPRLQIIPNPNNGTFEIVLSGNIYGNIQAKIFSVTGKVVYMKRFSKFTPYANEKFMTGNLASGLYFIELYSSDLKKMVSRFIIQH